MPVYFYSRGFIWFGKVSELRRMLAGLGDRRQPVRKLLSDKLN